MRVTKNVKNATKREKGLKSLTLNNTMAKKKPKAYLYEEGDGMFTNYCDSVEQAYQAMIECLEGWKITLDDPLNISEIKSEIAYPNHRNKECRYTDYTTIGENICNHCGEPTKGSGRKTFTYNF